MTKKFDQFDRLQAPGQYVVVAGVRPLQVSKLAKANVRRRLGPRAVVVSAYIEEIDSTFVALAYVPTSAPVPAKVVQPRVDDQSSDEARRASQATMRRIRAEEPDEPDEWDDVDADVG